MADSFKILVILSFTITIYDHTLYSPIRYVKQAENEDGRDHDTV